MYFEDNVKDLADFLDEGPEFEINQWNDHQRLVIQEVFNEHGQAWLGNVNLYDHNRDKPIIWKWNGQDLIYNFSCAFVLSEYDEKLEKMIFDRDNTPYTGTTDDYKLITAIFDRIEQISGKVLLWR